MTSRLSELYAHTPEPSGDWDYLQKHLHEVAKDAVSFAEVFGSGNVAHVIGLLHDIGKTNPDFQEYLKAQTVNRSHQKVPHAISGASLMYYFLWCKHQSDAWKEFALPVYGHHIGVESHGLVSRKFSKFLMDNPPSLQLMAGPWEELQKASTIELPIFRAGSKTAREMRIRMLFSALVDAD